MHFSPTCRRHLHLALSGSSAFHPNQPAALASSPFVSKPKSNPPAASASGPSVPSCDYNFGSYDYLADASAGLESLTFVPGSISRYRRDQKNIGEIKKI